MKKRGFTLVEAVVAIAIFFAAFVPLQQMTDNLMKMNDKKNRVESSGGSSENPMDEYTDGAFLEEIKEQTIWSGYNYLDAHFKGKTRSYTVTECSTGVYITREDAKNKKHDLISVDITKLPGNLNIKDEVGSGGIMQNGNFDARCYTAEKSKLVGKNITSKVEIKITEGKMLNMKTVKGAEIEKFKNDTVITNPPIFFGEIILTKTGAEPLKKEFIMTPLQDTCVSVKQ